MIGVDPDRPDDADRGARPGRGRHHPGPGARHPARRRHDPPACAEAVRRCARPTGSCSGPGSWFTCVMPHLLVPGAAATRCCDTPARRLLTLNLRCTPGETDGFARRDHLEVLAAHAPDLRIDVVLADPSVVDRRRRLRRAAADMGAELWLARWPPRQNRAPRLAAAGRGIPATSCG